MFTCLSSAGWKLQAVGTRRSSIWGWPASWWCVPFVSEYGEDAKRSLLVFFSKGIHLTCTASSLWPNYLSKALSLPWVENFNTRILRGHKYPDHSILSLYPWIHVLLTCWIHAFVQPSGFVLFILISAWKSKVSCKCHVNQMWMRQIRSLMHSEGKLFFSYI